MTDPTYCRMQAQSSRVLRDMTLTIPEIAKAIDDLPIKWAVMQRVTYYAMKRDVSSSQMHLFTEQE